MRLLQSRVRCNFSSRFERPLKNEFYIYLHLTTCTLVATIFAGTVAIRLRSLAIRLTELSTACIGKQCLVLESQTFRLPSLSFLLQQIPSKCL